ncbi:MAG: acetylglutamate kinase [Acidimicrobiales bacterium]
MTASAPHDPSTTSRVLVEAIPFIRRFSGSIVVVKLGGSALNELGDSSPTLEGFAQDVVLARSVGMLPVVVHGGGPQVSALMERLGKSPEFRAGLRVTDAETLDIARMVLVGKVNRDIVGALNVHAPVAVGLSGEDAGFIRATERDPELGFVGDISSVDPELLRHLLHEGVVPVIATIASGPGRQTYNVNADAVASAVAVSLKARKLIYLTDVNGVRGDAEDAASVLSRVSADELQALIDDGTVSGGMVPKARACIESVRGGVTAAHVLDGRVPHALLLELFTESGVGTMVTT